MYIFSRSTIAALGRQFDAFPAAVGVADMVTKLTGHEVNVFAGRFGAPQGSVMWSARVESMTELQGITDKLMADAGYLEMLESMNGLFMAPSEDRLGRVLTGPIDGPTSKYYGVTRAAMANGKQADAMAFGVKTAEYIGTSLGTQSAFTKSNYGGFNDVTWIIGFDTEADVDAFDDWQMTDSGYHDIVAEAGGLFVENSGHTSLIEKIN
ncbi:MAG TPA: hypothetical protein VMY16_09495 [Ilumatobacteraceae bacterium]|nr:hypothetical protein [Ilumatobacteraceae bacterium]